MFAEVMVLLVMACLAMFSIFRKKNFKVSFATAVLVAIMLPLAAFAQDGDSLSWLDPFLNFLFGWIQSNPKLAFIMASLYFVGLIFKPLFSLIGSVVLATKTKSDDEFLAKVYVSLPYKIIAYVLDLVMRIKLPGIVKQ